MLTQAEVRRRRLGGALAAAIGVVLIVLAVLAWTGKLGATNRSAGAPDAAVSAGAQPTDEAGTGAAGTSQATEPSSETAPSSESKTEEPADVKSPLTVLNGGGIAGLAAAGQTEFESAGWQVSQVGNYLGSKLSQSTVFYSTDDPSYQKAAKALVAQYPQLVAKEAPSDLGYDGVVVVLAGDWKPGQ